jgi:hypothetical protein
MKKNIFKFAALTLAGAFGLFSCGTTETVAPKAGKPSVDVTFDAANFGVQKDFAVSATVSTSGDTAYINMSVNGIAETGAIYMLYQKDSEKAVKFQTQPGGGSLPSAGYVGTSFDGASKNNFNYKSSGDYTFDIPNNINKAWKLTIPVKLRNTTGAQSDVFTIWVTKKSGSGRFDNPAKNLAYGVATVTLNYTNEKLVNYYSTELGSSKNLLIGSLFSTSTGSNYTRAYAQDTLKGAGVDFVYNNITAGKFSFGSFYANATNTNADITAGFGAITNIKRVIKIKEITSDFSTIVGETSLVAAVDAAAPTASFVSLTTDVTGKVFAFITADGKKGVFKVISSNAPDTDTGSVNLEVKVQR